MPTANYYVDPEDGWVALTAAAVDGIRISRVPANATLFIAGGSTTPSSGVKATQTIIFGGLPVADETVTIGTEVYTFKASAASNFQVTIGGTAAATAANLAAKINLYSALVTASAPGATVTITALADGTAGTGIAVSELATNVSVGGAATSGGVDAVIGVALEEHDCFEAWTPTADKFYVKSGRPNTHIDVWYELS